MSTVPGTKGTPPGFEASWLNTLGKLIGGLERFHLENVTPEEFLIPDLFEDNEQVFYGIHGLADFWSNNPGADFSEHMTDLVIGAHNQRKADLTMVVIGNPQRISIYISLGPEQTTRTILEGIFPHIRFYTKTALELAHLLGPHLRTKGVLTGIPSAKIGGSGAESMSDDSNGGQQKPQKQAPQQNRQGGKAPIERVIRGMYGASWAYIVQSHPRPRQKVAEERIKTIDLLTQVNSRARVNWQSTTNKNLQMTAIESGGETETYSGDMVNYRAQYLIKLLERELERLDQASAAGQWIVQSYFGASNYDDAQRLASLLIGSLAGRDSRPEPMRAMICKSGGTPLNTLSTFLTSEEVALLVQLPREEVPGYAVHDYVRFDVDFRSPEEDTVPLGHIQQNGHDIHDTFNISIDALAKHAVVIGVTGSGKTTTVMNLVDRVIEAGKTFLVIEPAKTEYRAMYRPLNDRGIDLRIYTLGNETTAPFRLNPFEFETDDEPGSVSVLSHIDFLKAVFNAAFILYSPMPHVLEEALHEVYEDKGWDLASGQNLRVTNWEERGKHPIFPTLTDLFYKVEEVTNRLGYDKEVESNVKAGLKARIGSLRIGSKGLMLDTPYGIPMQQLLAYPTILEMEGIGSDDEKTFMMGLFLAKLYEYRRLQAATGKIPGHLQHMIVIEEAHRLLSNTSTQVDAESSNPRAQAVEVFTNILSEMRAYGEGVLVAEQIPSKLAPDVLKNTNMKIIHRLIAQDDRESVGQTMNLNEEQQRHLGVLTPGMAAVYAEGADHAYLVRLENYKKGLKPLLESELKKLGLRYAQVAAYQFISDLDQYGLTLSPFLGPDPGIYNMAAKILDTAKSKWIWNNILLRARYSPGKLLKIVNRFDELIESLMPFLDGERHDALLRMVIVRGAGEIIHERGAHGGWSYDNTEKLRKWITKALVLLLQATQKIQQGSDEANGAQSLEEQMKEAGRFIDLFRTNYNQAMKRRQGPFIGCSYCPARCQHRSEVEKLLTEKDRKWVFEELTSSETEDLEQRYKNTAFAATSVTKLWLDTEKSNRINELGFCVALHVGAKSEFSEYEQNILGEGLQKQMFPTKENNKTNTSSPIA